MDAIQAISVQIDQQELAITTSREYDVLQHRPQKKSYKENQLGDIIDVMKTEPQPDDKAGGEAWIDRCSWGGILPSLDAIICMELFVFSLGFPLVCYAPAAICMHSLHNLGLHISRCFVSFTSCPDSSLATFVYAAEKFGGARGDTRRIIDLNTLYCFEAFCSTDDKNSSRFTCRGCQRASATHTCPHEMMECLSFAYMKSKSTC